MKRILASAFSVLAFGAAAVNASSRVAFADPSVEEKASDASDRAGRGLVKAKRAIQDKVCASGDLACAAERIEHKTQNAADKVRTKATEVKRKTE